MVHSAMSDTNFRALYYIAHKKWLPWEPVDINPIDRDEIADEDDKWDDDLMNALESRFDQLRQFNESFR